jgi:thiol:disulfide interchange protein DsbD
MIFRLQLFIFALFLITSTAIHAQESPPTQTEESSQIQEQQPVQVKLILEEETIQPGRPFWAAIHLKHQEHWHTYWKNPGDSGMPTAVEWNLPEGFTANPIVWPTPKKFIVNEAIGYGYENDTVLLVQLTPPQTLPQSTDSVALSANFRWVVCSDAQCIMGEFSTSTQLKMASAQPKINEDVTHIFTHARQQLPAKHENVQASRKGSHIELRFQLPEGSADHHQGKISFFPENNDVVDHAIEPIPFEGSQASNHYTVFLKSSANIQEKDLKGLVVIHNSTMSVSHSLEIQVPIAGTAAQSELISMADIPNKSDQRIGTSSHMAALPSAMESEFEGGLGLALLLAFAGGMILNLMPCVLPVISFKILSFVKLAGQSRVLTFKHGLAFSAGVLASFWVLAGVLLILQTYGHTVGWGFQLQEPIFVGILSAILLVFALSQFGIFEMGTSMTSWAGQAEAAHRSNGFIGSFFGGVLATAVATPCTGPFLGTAVGFAVTLPTILAMLMFTSLGLGMAAPYLVLTAYPRLLRFLPKPGAWMVTFKEIVGFFMLATVLWLLWVFGAQTDSLAVFMLLIGFFCLALGCWIYGKWGASLSSKTVRNIGRILTAVCFIAGGYMIVSAAVPQNAALHDTKQVIADNSHGADTWETFSPERVAELQSQGIPVLVDFTAKWCLICQANHLVFSSSEVNDMLNKLGVVKMKADWTRKDMMITQELRKFGRNSVPLYVLYGKTPSEQPQILPQVLTPATVLEHLEKV